MNLAYRTLVPSPVVPAQPLLREPTRQTTKPLPVVSAEKFVELEAASLARMFARYPSLKDRENPWRKKLDAYVGQQRADPKRTEFFNTSNWPERIVLEFGVVHGIADANGNAIQR